MNCPNCSYQQEQPFIFCPLCGYQRVELPTPKPPQPTIAKVILILLAWLFGAFAASFLGAMVAIFLGIYDMYGAAPAGWGTLLLGLILNRKQRRMRIGFTLLIIGLFIIPLVVGLLASGTLIKPIYAPVIATQRPNPTATYRPYPTSFTCISWSSVNMSHNGKSICVYGIAYNVYPTNGGTTRIRFSDQPNAIYLLNHRNNSYFPEFSPGDCVVTMAVIRQENGQLYMTSIDAQRQNLSIYCDSTPQPYATIRSNPPSTPSDTCISWSSVNMSQIGRTICVAGIVYDLYSIDEHSFRIRFINEPNAFFLLDQQGYYPDLRPGDCVVTKDIVRQENGLLYMSIEALYQCPWSASPSGLP